MVTKLGSLFDGSGGFPLAGALCGIEPIWASEIEPYPIAVTKSRLPKMKHLGDISKINGAEIEPVDIITFGSPCQDLSVAGKRAGLKHQSHGDGETTRSGLFMEAVRIIKEMREKTNGKYPRFALWENVPGAFSSNKGEDFRVVLEEIIKITEPNAVMPKVPQKGWAYSDSYCGDGWSVAYRVLDAQYWGVPQRRRRIYLVADFGGGCAQKILFEREGLRGYFTEGRTPWKTTTADAERGVGADDREGETALNVDNTPIIYTRGYGGNTTQDGISPTIEARAGTGGNNQPIICMACYDARGNGDGKKANTITGDHENRITNYTSVVICKETIALEGNGQRPSHRGDGYLVTDKSYTLNATEIHGVVYVVDQGGGKSQANVSEGMTPTLTCTHGGEPAVAYGVDVYNQTTTGDKAKTLTSIKSDADHVPCVTYSLPHDVSQNMGNPIAIDRAFFNQGKNALYDPQIYEDGTTSTLVAKGPGAVCTIGLNGSDISPTLISRMSSAVGTTQDNLIVSEKCEGARYIVRRLTPTECARLQGFADRWGDINSKTEFSDEEYKFWLDVRNNHAAINGKQTKEYTKAQMLTWYKKLHVDSSEYKMWGNGIALPTALYVMQGIKEVSNESYQN